MTNEEETLPVSCPRCHQATDKPIPWVQENTFYTCPGCGTFVLIDKDAAMKTLAALYHAAD